MEEKIEVNDFLDHHGVKGMRWGKRTMGQRASLGVLGAASYLLGRQISQKLNLNRSMTFVVTSGVTIAGANAAKAYLDGAGNHHVSDIGA